jgi:hypothetical protein
VKILRTQIIVMGNGMEPLLRFWIGRFENINLYKECFSTQASLPHFSFPHSYHITFSVVIMSEAPSPPIARTFTKKWYTAAHYALDTSVPGLSAVVNNVVITGSGTGIWSNWVG